MNVNLIDLDSKLPNIALMKLSQFYKQTGDAINFMKGAQQSMNLFSKKTDLTFVSCIFPWNREKAKNTAKQSSGDVFIGGTGISLHSVLPIEVENCGLDYSIYPEIDYAIGFISRGCIRKCQFCVVPKKEGKIRRISTAEEVVGDKKSVLFLDNNFLALSDYQSDLKFLAKKKILTDFNQGLDARLVNDESAYLLSKCRHRQIRLACDVNTMLSHVERAIKILNNYKISKNKICIYTLLGFNGFESDIEVISRLHEIGVSTFPMGYIDENGYEPTIGWNKEMYKKYKRLLIRVPKSKMLWDSLKNDITNLAERNQHETY